MRDTSGRIFWKSFALRLLFAGACICPQTSHAELAPPTFSPGGGLVKAPSTFTVTNPNLTGWIFYTLDGSDPRDQFGNVAPNARGYDFRITLNGPTQVRARVKSGSEWSDVAAAAFTTDQDFSKLLFTEIMYHPRDESDLEEFIELKNVGTKPLNLTGLHLAVSDWGPPLYYYFPVGTVIQPGEFHVLVNDIPAFRSIHPNARIDGRYLGELTNSGGAPRLMIRSENLLEVAYASYDTAAPWQVVPDNHRYFPNDGVGFSMVRVNYDPAVEPDDYRAWRSSTYRAGSPGADDPAAVVPPILITELLARSSSGAPDAVEFYNPNPFPVDIGRWWLSDERNAPFGFSIPADTVIPPLGYHVMDQTQWGGLAFSADGERCYLFSADADGQLTGYSHGFQFPPVEPNVTYGRYIASDGTETFPAQSNPTIGGANSDPLIPPVVISEVMYHSTGSALEYIELANTTNAPVNLWDPQRPQITWAVGLKAFPQGITIPANGFALLVEGDPLIFRDRFNVPADVPVVEGPHLPNQGADLVVYRSSGTANGFTRYFEVDRVTFRNRAPWPPGADGGGSLEKIHLSTYGNDPKHWRVSPGATPGRPNNGNLPPAVWAGADRVEFFGTPALLTCAIADEPWPGAVLTTAWEQLSGPASVAFSGPSATQTTVTFPVAGQYVLRLNASDGTFAAFDTVTIDVIARPFEFWQTTVFTPAELTDPTISGPTADPDGDQRLNFAEYLFASPPTVLDPGAIVAEITNARLQIRWRQRAEAPDVLVVPERADRVEGPWFGLPELFDRSEVDLGLMREITVRERLPVTGRPASFLRLRLQPR